MQRYPCTLMAGDVVSTWTEGDTDKTIHADLACEVVINLHKWFNDILVRVRLHGSDRHGPPPPGFTCEGYIGLWGGGSGTYVGWTVCGCEAGKLSLFTF